MITIRSKSKALGLLALACLAFLAYSATLSADGGDSCTFAGTARVDGSDVAGGTLITAIVEGDQYYTHTAPDSARYSLTIQPPEGKSYPDGASIAFKIDNRDTGQVAKFIRGTNQQLDLAASTKPTAWHVNRWIIIGLAFMALALGLAGFYLLVRGQERGFHD